MRIFTRTSNKVIERTLIRNWAFKGIVKSKSRLGFVRVVGAAHH
jgi:hypothetical protein